MNNRAQDFEPFRIEQLKELMDDYQAKKHFYSVNSFHFKNLERFYNSLVVTNGVMKASDLNELLSHLDSWDQYINLKQTHTDYNSWSDIDAARKRIQNSKTHYLFSAIAKKVTHLKKYYKHNKPYRVEDLEFVLAHPQNAETLLNTLQCLNSSRFDPKRSQLRALIYDNPLCVNNVLSLVSRFTDMNAVEFAFFVKIINKPNADFIKILGNLNYIRYSFGGDPSVKNWIQKVCAYKMEQDSINVFCHVANAIRIFNTCFDPNNTSRTKRFFESIIYPLFANNPNDAVVLAETFKRLYQFNIFATVNGEQDIDTFKLLFVKCYQNLGNLAAVLIIMKEAYLEVAPFRNILLQQSDKITADTIRFLETIGQAKLLFAKNFKAIILEAEFAKEGLNYWKIAPDHSQHSLNWVFEQIRIDGRQNSRSFLENESKSSFSGFSIFGDTSERGVVDHGMGSVSYSI